ncbi:conserved domain protein [Klebsiella sp. MS 92-3]|nr:conserved domain protein [Klebsiella sp. MS 92-3]
MTLRLPTTSLLRRVGIYQDAAGFTHRPSSSPGFFDFLLPLFLTLCHVDTPLSGNA